MATLQERLSRARDALVSAGIEPSEAALDVELLARHVLGWDRARLLSDGRDTPPQGFDERFDAAIDRRRRREPISQIIGHREFWGLDFEVTPDVLPPRPETELIVEEALASFKDSERPVIVDVGTGSGCLAIVLALELPNAEMVATDVSAAALEVARRNAISHGVNRRIAFVETDLFSYHDRLDLVVSNPPYIASDDAASLTPEVRDHEPHVALFGGRDGLSIYRRLLPAARRLINEDKGRLIVEVGYDQADAVTRLAWVAGWRLIRERQDLQGITRALVFASEGRRG